MSPETRILADLDAAAARLSQRMLKRRADLLSRWPEMTADLIGKLDDNESTWIEALLKTFEQLFDLAARQFSRAILLELGENIESFSALDAYNRLETLGASSDAGVWKELGQLRNRIAHSYPLDLEKQAKACNDTTRSSESLVAEVGLMRRFVRERDLLQGDLT